MNLECAKIARAQKDERSAAKYNSEAAEFMTKSGQKDDAARIVKDSVEGYKKSGNFDEAGVALKKLGEYYEAQVEPDVAINYYLQAVDMFSLAKFKTTEATKLKVKIADMLAEMTDKPEKLTQAIKVGLSDLRGGRLRLFEQQFDAFQRQKPAGQGRFGVYFVGGRLKRTRWAPKRAWITTWTVTSPSTTPLRPNS